MDLERSKTVLVKDTSTKGTFAKFDRNELMEHLIITTQNENRKREKEEKSCARTPNKIWSSANVPTSRTLTLLPPLRRSHTEIDLGTMHQQPRSPTPNHTMINERVPKSSVSLPGIKALVATSKPIPNLLDRPSEEKEFPKKDPNLWKDEVTKIVPKRPAIAIQSNWEAPPADWDDRNQYIFCAKPIFYKNIKYTTGKSFVVNPEWLSEFMTVSTYSRAYRTCALRYGWCA